MKLKLILYESVRNLPKEVAAILIAFFVLILTHFNLTTAGQPSIFHALSKIGPIVCLIVAINVSGVTSDYVKHIQLAFLNALVGDVLLVWQNTKLGVAGGTIAFSIAQYCLINAFGLEPRRHDILVKYCVPIAVINYVLMYWHLHGIFAIIVPIYTLFILAMFWRALAFYEHKRTHTSKLAVIAGVLFLVSDAVYGVELFSRPDLLSPRVFRYIVLPTYYLGMLALTLSVFSSNILTDLKTRVKFKK